MSFVVLYRWRLKPGREAEFQEGWRRRTREIVATCGGQGSRLHRADDGSWVAYAVWPSREARDLCREKPVSDAEAASMMHDSILESLPEIRMQLTDDLLAPPPE